MVIAPQGDGWCRITFDTEFQYLPFLAPDAQVLRIVPVLGVGVEAYTTECYRSIELDAVDFDSWSDLNESRPMDANYVAFASGIACGDTELIMDGGFYDTLAIAGMDNTTKIDCETGGHHP